MGHLKLIWKEKEGQATAPLLRKSQFGEPSALLSLES